MFVVKRKNLVILSVLAVTFFTFILCFFSLGKTVDMGVDKIKVVLDAGHGGIDGGVSGVNTLVKESELNLIVTKKLQNYLQNAGIEVVLTRSTQSGLYGLATKNLKRKDMQKRKEIILKAKPTLVVSVHMNKYASSSRRGGQVFYSGENEQAKILAQSVQSSFNELYSDIKEYSPLKGEYYILNCTPYPTIIAECGFLSSPIDESLLITEEHQSAVAYSIFKGIVEYLSKIS